MITGGGGTANRHEQHQMQTYSSAKQAYGGERMSVPPSRAQSEVFSASQYGGGGAAAKRKAAINYFIIPVFILEVIGLACLWALFYYLRFTTVFPYHHRVFDCKDKSLMKPDFEPNDFLLWVSPEVLYSVCFILPPLVILLGEIMFWLFSTKPRRTVYANCKECKVHLFTRRLLRFISVFMFGALIVCIFIDSIKLITGYQRPYFLTLCNVNTSMCAPSPSDHSPSPSPNRACMRRDVEDELRFAWLSFPSLYAGLSSYSAIFMSCYVHYMISLRGAPLLRPFLIFGFLGMALVATFSRIQGYKNHWVDVWPAWIIGVFTALYMSWNVLRFQEYYHAEAAAASSSAAVIDKSMAAEERISPFFSWFRLPRVTAPSRKDSNYSVYSADESPPQAPTRARARDTNRNYEVTTTTESFHRTISPPNAVVPNGINY